MKNVIVVLLLAVALQAHAQNMGRGLMINEVYIGTAGTDDQYIEIYNPQTTTQYLDGCIIVQFDTSGGTLSGPALTGASHAWKFPGSPGGTTLPVKSKAFAVVAANVSKHAGGLDLSTAEYEARASNSLPDKNAKQLTNLTPAMNYPGLTPSLSGDAIVLTNGTDATITDGVNISSILDAVQYGPTIQQGKFPLSVDTMRTGGQYFKPGFSIERNQAGVSTHNSYADFSLQYPTPGTQHVTQQQQTVTPADLMPFDVGRFVAFHQFDTASAGAAPSEFSSSQIVMQTGLSFQGQTGVALVRDSSYTSGSSTTISNLHFHATAAKDIEGFADDQLLQYMFGNFSTNLTPLNTWVPYLKMSAGKGVAYNVATISGSYSGATLTIPISAVYRGFERLTVSNGTFDSAYRFDLTAHVRITSLFGGDSIIVPTTIWLAKGIGILQRSNPYTAKTILTQNVAIDGSERDMYAFGIQSRSSVAAEESQQHRVRSYPNPVKAKLYLARGKDVKSITLFDAAGHQALYKEFSAPQEVPEISVQYLPAGSYMGKFEFRDGTIEMWPIAIRR